MSVQALNSKEKCSFEIYIFFCVRNLFRRTGHLSLYSRRPTCSIGSKRAAVRQMFTTRNILNSGNMGRKLRYISSFLIFENGPEKVPRDIIKYCLIWVCNLVIYFEGGT